MVFDLNSRTLGLLLMSDNASICQSDGLDLRFWLPRGLHIEHVTTIP